MDNKLIRQTNLRALLKDFTSDKAFANAVGMDPAHVSQIKHGKNMGDAIARKIERQTGKPVGWMDLPHTPAENGHTSDEYDNSPAPPGWYDQDVLVEAAAMLFEVVGMETAKKRGPKWTAATILKLHDLLRDPAASQLSRATILRLLD